MPKFHYTAKRGPQDVIEGVIEAEDRQGVMSQLTERGFIPVKIQEAAAAAPRPAASAKAAASARPVRPGRVPASQLVLFTRQFASLVHSYVPLLRALQILQDQTRHPYFRQILKEVTEEIRQGQTLSSGLAKFPKVFSPLYINLIRSGEVSGTLDVILERLAQQAEEDQAMRAKVRMAFVYPAFVAVVAVLTIFFFMLFVVPKLSKLFAGMGSRLPLPTRLLLTWADWMASPWFWAAAAGLLAGLIAAWKGLRATQQLLLDRLLLKVPFLGPVVLHSEVARFARSLGLQLTHGVAILQAIDVSVQVVEQRAVRAQLQQLPEGLRQGAALSEQLRGLSLSSPLLVNAVQVGEESGRVGEALNDVALFYERETERLLQILTTLLEPLLVVVVGVIVGFIVMAVLLPIFELGAGTP